LHLYAILGIPNRAEFKLVKAAYKAKAKTMHSDKTRDGVADPGWRNLRDAYAALSNERAKNAYDKHGGDEHGWDPSLALDASQETLDGNGGGDGAGDDGDGSDSDYDSDSDDDSNSNDDGDDDGDAPALRRRALASAARSARASAKPWRAAPPRAASAARPPVAGLGVYNIRAPQHPERTRYKTHSASFYYICR
jgi:curved DNA-binding protein CbpA